MMNSWIKKLTNAVCIKIKPIAITLGLIGIGFCLFTAEAQTNAWPQKPIKLIIPYVAGSAPDALGRAVSEKLSVALGQPIIVDNRPGAGGNIGFEAIAKSPNDGYTLGLATSGLAINASLYKKVPFDIRKDFSFLNLTFEMPHALIVANNSPFKSVGDLIAAMKVAPGKYNYSSGGNGTGAHLAGELFKSMIGARSIHIPYKGSPAIITSVISGDVSYGFPTMATVTQLVKAGKLRILGITSPKRNKLFPEIPAISETVKNYEMTSWFGLVGPSNMPVEIVSRIDKEMSKIVADSAFKIAMQSAGTDIVGLSSKEFTSYFSKDANRWKQAVEASGASLD